MQDRLNYIQTIRSLASNPALGSIPGELTRNTWIRDSTHIILAISPSVGAFMDWVIDENGGDPPPYDRAALCAVESNIAWYAAYMDVLVHYRSR